MGKIVFLAVLAFVALTSIPGSNGAPNGFSGISSRIIQGHPAEKKQFPHQVNLAMEKTDGDWQRCGGSLITNRWILTAAHCVIGMKRIYVRIGLIDYDDAELIIETKKFLHHEDYSNKNFNYDVGLIDLEQDIKTSDTIKIIRLPSRSQANDSFAGRAAIVSGFGFTENEGPNADILNFVNMKVITNDVCEQDYNDGAVIAATLCAVGAKNPSEGTCHGDSGGPLIIEEDDGQVTQIGVVSFVSSLGCDKQFASGFQRMTSYLDWISKRTGLVIRP